MKICRFQNVHKNMNHLTILEQVLKSMDEQNLQYCLLRNYEFLLDSSRPIESLDTLVAEADYPRLQTLLLAAGFRQRKPQFSLRHRAFFRLLGTKMVSFDVQVGGVYWNDLRYLEEAALARRVRLSFFYVLHPNDLAVMFIAHSILGKRYFKPKYWQIVSTLKTLDSAQDFDQEQVRQKLSFLFGAKAANTIQNALASNQPEQIAIYRSLLYFLLSHPQRLLIFLPLCWRWVKWKKVGQSYPLISFIGPDGAGKSTMLAGLQHYLQERGRKVAVVYCGRGRKQLLPGGKIAAQYKRWEKKKDQEKRMTFSREPEKNFPKGEHFWTKVLYPLAAPWYALDLALRYAFLILPRRRTKTIVLTDRYCSDLYLMKHLPRVYASLFLWLFPQPSFTFYLYQDLAELKARRPQESEEGLQRQLALFAELQKKLGALAIKTTDPRQDLEQIIQRVETFLLREWY